jgi:predicted nuclease of predicted toxin-antitoxin system
MRFLVDAQLSERLKRWLLEQGHDAVHTNDLPLKHLTPDKDIIRIADVEDRVVISKDSDFYKYKLIFDKPKRIVFITTGNISNSALMGIFELNFHVLVELFDAGSSVIEISNTDIVSHM